MIVVDSSAVIAILNDEAEADALSSCLALHAERLISAASYLEVGTVLAGRRRSEPDKAQQFLNAFLEEAYALAKSLGAPLLYVGDDFTGTDIEPALESA